MAAEGDSKKRRLDPVDASTPVVTDAAALQLKHNKGTTIKVPGLLVTSHRFRVPLDHSNEVNGDIELFVREVVSLTTTDKSRDLPCLLFLQGGPGFEAPRPMEASTWMKSAVASFRVFLLDQRGTGHSNAITVANLHKQGSAAEQARYLSFFRADSIVRDAELVRKVLVPKESCEGRWSVLGQSFGGFCTVTYMSLAPQGLSEALLTGGLPPSVSEACGAEALYRIMYTRVIAQNTKFYARYPGDVAQVQLIVKCLAAQPGGGARLPSGSLLTPRGLQLLGLAGLGMGGGFERLHYILESFFDSDGDINPGFLKAYEGWVSFDSNPLYALIHEACYCQGAASRWAAHRVREAEFSAQFDAVECAANDQPVLFTGEMVFPWLFDDFAALRPYKAAAELLASKEDWPPLYDVQALQANKVPAAAATYLEDMYVDYNLGQVTAGHIAGLRQWITNEYKHSGIRDDGVRIFDRLLSMARDTLPIE